VTAAYTAACVRGAWTPERVRWMLMCAAEACGVVVGRQAGRRRSRDGRGAPPAAERDSCADLCAADSAIGTPAGCSGSVVDSAPTGLGSRSDRKLAGRVSSGGGVESDACHHSAVEGA
jgi:hypothetical protein